MKVAIGKITEQGLKLDEKIPAALLNLDGFDLKFVDYLTVEAVFNKIYSEITSKVDIRAHCQITCSRCLIEVGQIKKYGFQKSYQLNKLGDFLDINDQIREEILLNFSLKVLCSPDCQGLCPCCGRNLNWGECNCLKSGN
ncbi:MAG: YceD family protein [Candidatus Omnitrophica bacterium]|nr:YceD family protein [Candidatus Omnitrophota bacterium]MCF7876858.1 YceD family protein [Candidatus Omnitrophota bacterium]MCF7877883.1 YceD family protein [Candidatus Omnitrophota bacterium]MCF7892575.1 YceD family protein [Candidatus Omnitrophota bacterium]